MCGIVGVVGSNQAKKILLNGLAKLEYRGYDSAGIDIIDTTGENHLLKSAGKLVALQEKVPADLSGDIGIGHTRWATHGEANENNAHPHQSADGRFVLVHNGVINNALDLKKTYLSDAVCQSETDSEVAVQLVAQFVKAGLEVEEAFVKMLGLLSGSYAFVMLDLEQADRLYVAKNKSPLLIGIGDGLNVVASDALAVINETNQFLELHDQEYAILTSDMVVIKNLVGEIIERTAFTAEIDSSDTEKGLYPFYMLKEIEEQPAVIRKMLQTYRGEKQQFQVDDELLEALQDRQRIYLVACGTSWHAAWVGKNLLEKLAGIPAEVHLASEFAYNQPILVEKPFFIFISQSGETADCRQVLVAINEKNYPSLTITNASGSTLSRESDYTLLLHAGPEIAVASTKAYTAQITMLAILAKCLGEKKHLQMAGQFDLYQGLSVVADGVESIIDHKEIFEKVAKDYLMDQNKAFYIGRGIDYYVSMENALKLKEISYIHTEGFAAGELKHGTIALIEKNTPVIAIVTEEKVKEHTRSNLQEVASRGAHTLLLVMESLAQGTENELILPEVNPLLTPLISVVSGQLIAYYASLQRGYDVDKPRNLAKSVTVE